MDERIELDLRALFSAMMKKAWLIVICAFLLGALTLGYTALFVTPQYQAGVIMYVNNSTTTNESNNYISAADLATAQRLVLTYVNIIKSDTVLSKVAKEAGLNLSPATIRSMMTSDSIQETELFQVVITSPDPDLSARIANAIAEVAPDAISEILDGSSAKIVDYAKVPNGRSSPSFTKNTILGALAGALLAVGLIVIQMLMDVRIKSEDDLAKISQVPVLGSIPDFTSQKKGGY